MSGGTHTSKPDKEKKEETRIRRNDMCVFNKTLAEWLGLNEAIIFEYIMFMWTNRYLGKLIDDKWWLYFSVTDLHDKFPFIGRATIHRTLLYICKNPVTLKKPQKCKFPLLEQGNFNKHKYDRTTWFTPTTEGINLYKEAVTMSQYETSTSHFKKSYSKLRNAFYKIGVKIGKME